MKSLNSYCGRPHLHTRYAGSVFLAVVLATYVAPLHAQAKTVATTVIQTQSVASAHELDGVVQAVRQSTVAAQAAGRVLKLVVKAGEPVRAGQVLAMIDDREAAAGVQRSQAQIDQADAELRNAQSNAERARDLQSKGFVSKAALDTAQTQLKSASAMREQAVASALQSTISQGFTRVTAPYDGWVLQTHAEAGDLAVPGRPLVTVYAPLPLRVVVQVPASRLPMVRAAVQTLIQLDDVEHVGQWIVPVTRTAVPSSDPVTQTTEWRFDLAPIDSMNLVPGQQVRVRFSSPQTTASAQKLLVPQSAIVRRGELTAVYVVLNGAFSLRAVRLGSNLGGLGVEVLAGVESGQVVALDPIRAGFANATPAAPSAK